MWDWPTLKWVRLCGIYYAKTGAKYVGRNTRLNFSSVTTLEKYIGHLKEAYLVYVLQRYSHKAAERSGAPKKIYLVDNGYVAAAAVQLSPGRGRLSE